MTTLRVIIDQMLAPVPGGIGRYTEELTRALVTTAPLGCDVAGLVSSSTDDEYTQVLERLPGLSALHKSAFARRELAAAWQHGFTRLAGSGMLHSPSLMAPLRRHDRLNTSDQTVVTIHDAVPWTHPQTLTARGVAWHKAMARRAERFADGVVVPTQAVADQLSEILELGDRVRVIGGAVSQRLRISESTDIAHLALPEQFALAVGTLEPRKGLKSLIRAMALSPAPDIPLIIAGPNGWGDVDVDQLAGEAGLGPDAVRTLGFLSDRELASVMAKATVFVFPSQAEGFGLPMLEAMSLGTPVIHTDVPALCEVAADAGLVVPLLPQESFEERLATAIRSVVDDRELSVRMATTGSDRAKMFSWTASASKVWQLHADL